MKTSLLVLSALMASTNAIDILAAPAVHPAAAKAPAPKESDPAAVHAAPAGHPHIVEHKVDSPAHHVVAKGHVDIKKAAAAHAPVVKDDDVHVAHADDKVAVPKDDSSKCMTNSCKAARAIKKLDSKKDAVHAPKPDAPVKIDDDEDAHHDKPKMVVVHKAEAKPVAHPDPAHAIKVRPAAKHADPTTKAHQKLIEAKLKSDSASQEAANEKAKATADVKSQKSLHHEAKKAKLQAHHDSKEASLKAVAAHVEKAKADKATKEASKPDAPEHVKVAAKRQAHVAAKAHQDAQDA